MKEPGAGPVLGYFARMCPEKGLDTLVDAFVLLRQRGKAPARLRVGGSCGPADERFVATLREKLQRNSLLGEVEFCPNLPREEKIAFLKSLSVFSVPAPGNVLFKVEARAFRPLSNGATTCSPNFVPMDQDSLSQPLKSVAAATTTVKQIDFTGCS